MNKTKNIYMKVWLIYKEWGKKKRKKSTKFSHSVYFSVKFIYLKEKKKKKKNGGEREWRGAGGIQSVEG